MVGRACRGDAAAAGQGAEAGANWRQARESRFAGNAGARGRGKPAKNGTLEQASRRWRGRRAVGMARMRKGRQPAGCPARRPAHMSPPSRSRRMSPTMHLRGRGAAGQQGGARSARGGVRGDASSTESSAGLAERAHRRRGVRGGPAASSKLPLLMPACGKRWAGEEATAVRFRCVSSQPPGDERQESTAMQPRIAPARRLQSMLAAMPSSSLQRLRPGVERPSPELRPPEPSAQAAPPSCRWREPFSSRLLRRS